MLRLACIYCPGLLVFCLIAWAVPQLQKTGAVSASTDDPNAPCAGCHRDIYERYRKTPMANASGPAADGFIPGDFVHNQSAIHYRVAEEGGRVWLSYERNDKTPERYLKGRQELRYFIGSGKRGRTFLFEKQGYWFEAPINWYGKKQVWDMAPNYLAVREMPMTLPVDPGCLHCHASSVAHSLPEARNLYPGVPFEHGGITCAACHGDATAHLASSGKTPMMNIDALDAARRDSVCLNCHLEGQTAVMRNGKDMADFRPGDDLSDFALFFVYKAEKGSGGRATSQWEALLRSECKKGSGDRLTCTTCHDPHGSPAPAEKVAFYRQKCLQCHNTAGFSQNHHPENPDCSACHMARPTSNDIAHEQVTDHWIKMRISNQRLPLATGGDLEPVGGKAADDRDLGLAYAQMAARGDKAAGQQALALLKRSEAGGGARGDAELHAQLGFLEQMSGRMDAATEEYEMALKANPNNSLAAGDLALIQAGQHEYVAASKLWEAVFNRDPSQLGAGMNLAIVQCGLGNRQSALSTLDRLVEFAPDDSKAKVLGLEIRSGHRKCGGQ